MPTAADFTNVTEVPGNLVTSEAIDRLWTRYAFAGSLCHGKDVLEVACGPGPGLSYLAGQSRRVVGSDYMENLLREARRHTNGRVPVVRLDAQDLPFLQGAFDIVLLFEAIYYLPDADRFVREAHRVLRPGGKLLVVSDNPAYPDFNPSPFSRRYYDSNELRTMLVSNGFDAAILGSGAAPPRSARAVTVSAVKRAAVRLRLIPSTMAGKERLKRLFYGRLTPFPAALAPGMGRYDEPAPLDDPAALDRHHQVIFAVGSRI